jgi:heme/copper-type cytochrome/quinol oxidase subunit 2
MRPYNNDMKSAAPKPIELRSVWAVTMVLVLVVVAVVVYLALLAPMI